MKTVSKVDIDIDKDDVYRFLGYPGRSPSAAVLTRIDAQLVRAKELIKPVYTYEIRAIEGASGQSVYLEGKLVLFSRTVHYVLSACKWGVVYLATIGPGLSKELSRLIEAGDQVGAMVLDAIGTAAIVQIERELQRVVKEIARRKGCSATVGYYPGYCDWHVSQQKVIFKVVDPSSVGVKLTDSCMMVPEKSISGIFGIGKLDTAKPPCLAACHQRKTCTHRRYGWDPQKQHIL